MNKFAFTYLVKQDEKTWFDLTNSLYLLNKLILSKLKCNYKVLIFCEGPPSEKADKLINFLLKKNINIKLKEISLKKYVKRDSSKDYISGFPYVSACTKNFSLGYKDMCKFFAIDIFNDIELSDSEYYVRLDTDSFFLDVKDKFIKNIQNIKEDYGYINTSIQKEDKSVSLGFGNCLYEFIISEAILVITSSCVGASPNSFPCLSLRLNIIPSPAVYPSHLSLFFHNSAGCSCGKSSFVQPL